MPDLYFATCPKGTAELLAAELAALGALSPRLHAGGVSFEGDLACAYRVLLWSRVANRLLRVVASFEAHDEQALYAGVRAVDWDSHLAPDGTLAVDAVCQRSQLSHSLFVAQRVKDAVVDQMRERHGLRPTVDTHAPNLRLNLYLDRDRAQLAIDLSGASLHQRHYRGPQGAAPLKENLAAAILLRARWPAIAARGGALFDPMCGSGTFLIEGALIAADIAPGLLRGAPGCAHWRGHDATLWDSLWADAEARRERGLAALPPIVGQDADPRAVAAARDNALSAGLAAHIRVEVGAVGSLAAGTIAPPGLVVCNPPYGERLGTRESVVTLYRALGAFLREAFSGWDAALLIGEASLGNTLGIRAQRVHSLFNGALECTLLRLQLTPENYRLAMPPGSARVARAQQRITAAPPSEGALMFANRLRKNLRHFGRWARRHDITCYRLYDADMPEYAVAVDLYTAESLWVHVQEYVAPDTVDEARARQRLDEALAQIPEVLEVPAEQVIFKRRQRQRGKAQYERLAEAGNFIEVREHGLKLRVNLRDYLDTGLFLDHRLTRGLLRERARDRAVLNLFAYTGTASVHAAAGGARRVLSIDMSATYCEWARLNLALNGFGLPRFEVLQADCLRWLEQTHDERFGLIFLDPPTFSNSTRMQGTLDVQRDHVSLIHHCMRLLTPDGVLIFSTNHRRFRLDSAALAELDIRDRSHDTLPEDFRRNARIHQCFEISRDLQT